MLNLGLHSKDNISSASEPLIRNKLWNTLLLFYHRLYHFTFCNPLINRVYSLWGLWPFPSRSALATCRISISAAPWATFV